MQFIHCIIIRATHKEMFKLVQRKQYLERVGESVHPRTTLLPANCAEAYCAAVTEQTHLTLQMSCRSHPKPPAT